MKVQQDSLRVNPRPCNEQDEQDNWQTISENTLTIEPVIQLLEAAKTDPNAPIDPLDPDAPKGFDFEFDYTTLPDGQSGPIGIRRDGDKYIVEFVDVSGGGGGQEKFRAVRARVVSDTSADSASFVVDTIVPLANGLNPADPNGELTVQKVLQESLPEDTQVIAAFNGSAWELLAVERYRLISGFTTQHVLAAELTFNVNDITALASGLDPRLDPNDNTEQIEIHNVLSQSIPTEKLVYAAYNATLARWEAIKYFDDGPANLFSCSLDAPIPATSLGTGDVTTIGCGGNGSLVGNRILWNPYSILLPNNCLYTCMKTCNGPGGDSEDQYTIIGIDPLHVLAALAGFDQETALYTSQGTVQTMQWAGEECPPPPAP